jgi:hypothetical protein
MREGWTADAWDAAVLEGNLADLPEMLTTIAASATAAATSSPTTTTRNRFGCDRRPALTTGAPIA